MPKFLTLFLKIPSITRKVESYYVSQKIPAYIYHKTYTLSYYDNILRELIKLAAMVTQTEDQRCCEILFRLINRMCQEFF